MLVIIILIRGKQGLNVFDEKQIEDEGSKGVCLYMIFQFNEATNMIIAA